MSRAFVRWMLLRSLRRRWKRTPDRRRRSQYRGRTCITGCGLIADLQLPCSLRRLGLTHYFPSGTDKDLKFLAGLDHESILNAVQGGDTRRSEGRRRRICHNYFSLADNARKSRFHTLVESFISNLISENGYMETLREKWAKRDVSAEKFPGNEQLRSRLKHL